MAVNKEALAVLLAAAAFVFANAGRLGQTAADARSDTSKADAGGAVETPPSCDLMALTPVAGSFAVHGDFLAAMQRSNACLADTDAAVEEKARCAESANSELAAIAQSPSEKALLEMQRAGVAALRGDDEAAARSYAEALSSPSVEPAVRRLVATRYAGALLAKGDAVTAIRALQENFDCETWTADALSLRGAAYARLFATDRAKDNYAAAIRLFGLEQAGAAVGREEL